MTNNDNHNNTIPNNNDVAFSHLCDLKTAFCGVRNVLQALTKSSIPITLRYISPVAPYF